MAIRQVSTPSPQSMTVPSSEELEQRLLVPLQLWQLRPVPVIPCSALAIICLPCSLQSSVFSHLTLTAIFVCRTIQTLSPALSIELQRLVLQVHTYPAAVWDWNDWHTVPSTSTSPTPQLMPHTTCTRVMMAQSDPTHLSPDCCLCLSAYQWSRW